jgi:hypothetical protein
MKDKICSPQYAKKLGYYMEDRLRYVHQRG